MARFDLALLLISAVVCATAVASAAPSDVCEFTKGEISTYRQARDCFESIPFNGR
jgi:hypothetical protein